jgi:hypothetical protein
MSAAERRDPEKDGWRRRQERMRFEVLRMLHQATHGDPDQRVEAWGFAHDLGVWEEELQNTVVWLEQAGYLRVYHPGLAISITLAGIHYLEHGAGRRRTIRGIAPHEESEK